MSFEYLVAIRQFIAKYTDPIECLKNFSPLILTPLDLAALLEKMQGLYDLPADPPLVDIVLVGSNVRVRDTLDFSEMEVVVVLPQDSDPAMGRISVLSPLGSALLRLKKGETTEVYVGNRTSRFQVIAID